MSSFFAQSAAMRQAMPQLRSAPKGISEVRQDSTMPFLCVFNELDDLKLIMSFSFCLFFLS